MHSPIIQGEIDTCAATVVGGGPRPRGGRGGAAWTRRDRLGPRAAAAPGRAMPFDGLCRRPPAARRHRRRGRPDWGWMYLGAGGGQAGGGEKWGDEG